VSARRLQLGAVAALLAACATGCGSGSTTTEQTSATIQWANGICSAISSYRSSVKEAASTIQSGNVSQEGLSAAVDDITGATQTLTTTVRGLDKPATESADTVQKAFQSLAADLRTDAKAIDEATSGSSSFLNTVSVVSTTLATAQTQAQTALTDLKTVDAKGELKDAFDKASSCS
jgi:hypothetical protein